MEVILNHTKFQLVRDSELAQLTGMSRSWVRKQRMHRRRGAEHVLKIDPVMIGSAPRYRLSDIETWLSAFNTDRGE
jgi:predicted DNA-binding transcriptional regulator AlpA